MSIENLYEYIKGEFKAINRVKQQPVSDDADTWFRDENQVKLAGYNIEIWSAATAGTQLTLGTDYTLALRDEAISGNEGFDVYAGFSIINATYNDVDLFLTANIVGGYTTRPYRPPFTTVTANTTFTPSSMDDSIIADASSAGFAITLADPDYDNQRVAVICSGDNAVEIVGTGLETAEYTNLALQFVGIGGSWLQLGGAGTGGGGGSLGVGEITWYPGSGAVPTGKLVADGSTYNIATYPALYAKYGTLYGGDGTTTFGVPDLQGITPGAFGTQDISGRTKGDATAIGSVREDQMQQITGSLQSAGFTRDVPADSGAITANAFGTQAPNAGSLTGSSILFDSADSPDARTGEYTRSTELVGRWLIQAFDFIQEVPADPSLIKDWVEKFNDYTNTAAVVNSWGSGYYKIVMRDSTDAAQATNLVQVYTDGFSVQAGQTTQSGTTNLIAKYTKSSNSFATASDSGTWYIAEIYRWEDVLASDAQLNPPVDGWETVFEDYTATSQTHTLLVADGEYEVSVLNVSNTLATAHLQIKNSATVCKSPWDPSYDLQYTTATGVWDSNLASFNIVRIRKFNGLLNVIHTDPNGIIQDEEVGGQWVTRWGTGRMEITGNDTISTNGTVTFESEFTAAPQIVCTCRSTATRIATIDSPSGTSFGIYVHTDTGASSTADTRWIAIGRWK